MLTISRGVVFNTCAQLGGIKAQPEVNSPMRRSSTVTIAIFLPAALRATAQTPATGAISGIVFDPAHRGVAEADVSALNKSTHATPNVKSGAEGEFRISLLPPGDYAVTITATGFAAGGISSVHVAAGEVRSLRCNAVSRKNDYGCQRLGQPTDSRRGELNVGEPCRSSSHRFASSGKPQLHADSWPVAGSSCGPSKRRATRLRDAEC